MWTKFTDMASGGKKKEKWDNIYTEASEEDAIELFRLKFGHDPLNVTCSCCGEDYSISTNESLEQLTAYDRRCKYDVNNCRWLEEFDTRYEKYYGVFEYITLKDYLNNEECLFITMSVNINGELL